MKQDGFKPKPTQERIERKMHNSVAVFLISNAARAVMVRYQPAEQAAEPGYSKKPYMFKTLDPNIKVDDFVVVETGTRWGMTVCKVTEVDVDVDYEANIEIKWIVGVVHRADFDELKLQEATAIKKVQSAKNRRVRDQLRDDLINDMDDAELKALPIYDVKTPQTVDPKPAKTTVDLSDDDRRAID